VELLQFLTLNLCGFDPGLEAGPRKAIIFKAMKSSPLLGPFCGSEFWGFSLLKI
jgi:hypothetical protein